MNKVLQASLISALSVIALGPCIKYQEKKQVDIEQNEAPKIFSANLGSVLSSRNGFKAEYDVVTPWMEPNGKGRYVLSVIGTNKEQDTFPSDWTLEAKVYGKRDLDGIPRYSEMTEIYSRSITSPRSRNEYLTDASDDLVKQVIKYFNKQHIQKIQQ